MKHSAFRLMAGSCIVALSTLLAGCETQPQAKCPTIASRVDCRKYRYNWLPLLYCAVLASGLRDPLRTITDSL